MKLKIIPILSISLLLGILFDYFFYSKTPGISVVLYIVLLFIGLFYLANLFKFSLNTSVYILTPATIFFASMVAWRANEALTFFNIILAGYLLLLLIVVLVRPSKQLHQYTLTQYFKGIGVLIPRFLKVASEEFRSVALKAIGMKQKSAYRPYLRGILLSLPFLFVFVLLLSSADMIFQKYVGSLFDIHLNGELIIRLILILIASSLLTGAYALIFMRPSDDEGEVKLPKATLGPTESTIILGSVGSLFLIFVLIQITYFFGGSDNIVSTGLTYADYARKGFFELITVSVITILLLLALKKSTDLQSDKAIRVFKYLSVALIVEVLIIMLSAHMRLSLYEAAYGFTTLRLFSHLFIVWLVVAFLLLGSYIWRGERENQFAFRLFLSVLVFFILLNIINPDAVVARQNITRYYETGKLDLYYLSRLSPDAIPATTELLSQKDQQLVSSLAYLLHIEKNKLESQDRGWQSTNLSRERARQMLTKHNDLLNTNQHYRDNYIEFDYPAGQR